MAVFSRKVVYFRLGGFSSELRKCWSCWRSLNASRFESWCLWFADLKFCLARLLWDIVKCSDWMLRIDHSLSRISQVQQSSAASFALVFFHAMKRRIVNYLTYRFLGNPHSPSRTSCAVLLAPSCLQTEVLGHLRANTVVKPAILVRQDSSTQVLWVVRTWKYLSYVPFLNRSWRLLILWIWLSCRWTFDWSGSC